MTNVNRMIQEQCRQPATMARMRTERERVFGEYGLSEEEKAVLRAGDTVAMVTGAGVHPILAFHYLFAVQPELLEVMSLKQYPELLQD